LVTPLHPADPHKTAADGKGCEAECENVGADVVDDHVDTLLADLDTLLADHPRNRGAKPLAAGDDPGIQPK
jgi:hypothetical protein